MAEETLEQLAGGGQTVEDLAAHVTEAKKTAVHFPSSNRNIASGTALMSADDSVQVYTAALMEAEQEGTYSRTEQVVSEEQARFTQPIHDEVWNAMGGDLSPQQKAMLLESQQHLTDFIEDERVALKTAAASDDSAGSTDYDEEVRMASSDARVSMDYENAVQAAIINSNAKNYMGDFRGLEATYDAASYYALPFVEQENAADVLEFMTGEDVPWYSLLGNTKQKMNEYFNSLPEHQLLSETERLISFLESEEGNVLFGRNDLHKMQFLREEIINGNISDTEVFIDNLVSVVDLMTIVGGRVIKMGANAIRGSVNPMSTVRLVGKTNTGKAREAVADIVDNQSDDVAMAVAGTDRTSAIADELSPEIVGPPVSNNKVYDPTKVDSFTDAEKRAKELELTIDLRYMDTHPNVSASQFEMGKEGSSWKVHGVYQRDQGGWLTAQDAIDNVKFALRKYGVADEQLTVLKNTDEGFVPVSKIDDTAGEYKVQLDAEFEMSALDARDASVLDSNFSFFGLGKGLEWAASKNPIWPRYLKDPGSLFKKEFTGTAATAVEQSAQLEKNLLHLGSEYGRSFSSLRKAEQGQLWDYFMKANKEGLNDSYANLRASGLNEKQVEVAQKWRTFWDEAWRLENQDARRTLQARGFEVFEHGAGETYSKFFVKPFAGPAPEVLKSKVLDPMTGELVWIGMDELKALYAMGGKVARLSAPEKVGKEFFEFVRIDDTMASYSRGINDFDKVLDYRPGYYKVQYKAPIFIREKLPNGQERAVAVAANSADAEAHAKQLRADTGGEYRVSLGKEFDDFETEMSMASTSGRSAQRYRGKRLENSSDPMNVSVDDRHIVGPVDAVINASRSIARRAPARVWIEGMKKRWIKQYGHLMKEETKQFGEVQWPTQHSDIGLVGMRPAEVANAKQAWEYIRYMENGYTAGIDQAVKAPLLIAADLFAKAGMKTMEGVSLNTAAKAGIVSPIKGAAFQMYLATNPLRQMLVQGHQFTQLAAIEPRYFGTGLAKDFTAIITGQGARSMKDRSLLGRIAKANGMTTKELDDMIDGFENSGLTASIDHQNLVESSLNQMVDDMYTRSKTKGGVGAVLSLPRRIGFDAGENVNLLTAYLTMRNRGLRNGMVDSVDSSRQWAQEARNFTYQMNRAGDLPYNQNSLGVIMQFMQVPHKALTTMTLNRSLNWKEKASLIGLNLGLYGAPATAIYNAISSIPGLEETVGDEGMEIIQHGFEQAFVNYTISAITGEESDLSLKNLAPLEFGGWKDLVRVFATEGAIEMLKQTPGGALLGGRAYDAISDIGRGWFYEDGIPELTTMQRIETFFSISSGYSNYFLTRMAQQHGEMRSSSGTLQDDSISTGDLFGKMLGLPTKEALARYELNSELYSKSQDVKKDAQEWWKDYKRVALRKGEISDKKAILDAMSVAWKVWSEPEQKLAREEILRLMNRDFADPDLRLIKSILRMSGVNDIATTKRMLRDMDMDPEQRQKLIALLEGDDG